MQDCVRFAVRSMHMILFYTIGVRHPQRLVGQVGRELRVMTGSRKRYVNRNCGKLLMFDTPAEEAPSPSTAELVEDYAANIRRAA